MTARLWSWLKDRWEVVVALGAFVLLLLGYRGRRRQSPADRHLQRAVHSVTEEMERELAEGQAELDALDAEEHAADARIETAALEARNDVEESQGERFDRPGRLDPLGFILGVLLPLCTPSPASAQLTEAITAHVQAAQAEVPNVDLGPCLPTEGRWTGADGVARCYPCPGVAEYVSGLVKMPEGCPTLVAGVLVELERFKRLESDAAGLRARSGALEVELAEVRGSLRTCKEERVALAERALPALETCGDLADSFASPGHSTWTVAGAVVVGVAVGIVAGALLIE